MAQLDYDYLSSLVRKVQNGNTDAFAELYAATYQKQYWFACRFMNDPYLAQDVLQELYILVFKHINTLKNPDLFISWLNQINFRLCFDMNKKNCQDQKELCFDDASFTFPETQTTYTPPQLLFDRDWELLEEIKELPKRESRAILMKYYGGMTLDEIAFAMDCSRSSVKRYLKSGYEKLRMELGDTEGGSHEQKDYKPRTNPSS